MCLKVILSRLDATETQLPVQCAYQKCGGQHYRLHQVVQKPLRDAGYHAVEAYRYQCFRCGRTFHPHPTEKDGSADLATVKGFAELLYLLALGYGAVLLVPDALGDTCVPVPSCRLCF